MWREAGWGTSRLGLHYRVAPHRLGPRAMAAAHALHYQVGIPVRKTPLVLNPLTGMELTQGAITQDALRRAKGSVGQMYQALRAGVRNSPDDTGWEVGGEPVHLMAFDTDEATVYQVRPRHRHQEAQEVVPRNYQGVMGTDRGRSYEDKSFRRVKQCKCLAHLQRTLGEVLDRKKGRAREWAERTRELLRLAVGLWQKYHYGDRLRDRPLKDQDNQKLLGMLRRYHQRGELLRFLEQPEVEPTNNRVERVLRPAVIVRKVSQCSKTWSGADAFATFTSVIQTLLKKGAPSSVVEALAD
ncbi:MAG TPA: transposase, partial [Dehalococcoidia bacterium]|nr:transposase [Dehalococcoidia bacterium]